MYSLVIQGLTLFCVMAGSQVHAHHESGISSVSALSTGLTNSTWLPPISLPIPMCTFCKGVATHTKTVEGTLTTHTSVTCTTITSCTETTNPWGTPTCSDSVTATETASCWENGDPWPCTKPTSGWSSTSRATTTIYETVPCSGIVSVVSGSTIATAVPYPTTNGTTGLTTGTATATPTPTSISSARGNGENLDTKVKMGFLALFVTGLVACVL